MRHVLLPLLAVVALAAVAGATAAAAPGASTPRPAASQLSPDAPVGTRTAFRASRPSRGRCTLRAARTFAADRPYRYRGRMTLQVRAKGSSRWRFVVRAYLIRRTDPTSRGRGSGAMEATVRTSSGRTARRLARGARFRGVTTHRVAIRGRAAVSESYVNALDLRRCRAGSTRKVAGPARGTRIPVVIGSAPSGGAFRVLAAPFGRSQLCVALDLRGGLAEGCGFAVPRSRALGSITDVRACGDSFAVGVVAARISVVQVRFGDGSFREVRPQAPSTRLGGARFFAVAAVGPVGVRVVRARDARGRTVALDETRATPETQPLPPRRCPT